MNACNALHHPAVTMLETEAVNMFHLTDVRRTKPGDGNELRIRNIARHAASPDQLFTEVAVCEAMKILKKLYRCSRIFKNRGDYFELRLRKIGGNVTIGQCRTQALRMRFLR